MPIDFTTSLKHGDNVWVWLTGGPAESRFVLRAVEPFEIGLRQIGEAQYRVEIRNNLLGSPKPEIGVGLKSSGLTIVQDGDRVTIKPPSEIREISDTLVIRAQYESFQTVGEFPVRTMIVNPSLWQAVPDEGFSWGYAIRGGAEAPGDTQTGACFYHTQLTSGGVTKDGIFSHPPYQSGVGYVYGITRPIAMPDKNCAFETFIGIKDGGDESDGVIFSVLALDEAGREHPLLEEHWAKREWKQITVDLSSFRGRTIRLKLMVDVGPQDNSTADWASWGEPRVILKEPLMRIEVKR